jgi:hypothetical protein
VVTNRIDQHMMLEPAVVAVAAVDDDGHRFYDCEFISV